MIFVIFFISSIYGNTVDFILGLDSIDNQYLVNKIYLNWLYLICSIFIVSYSIVLQNDDISTIDNCLNDTYNNLNKLGDDLLNGRN